MIIKKYDKPIIKGVGRKAPKDISGRVIRKLTAIRPLFFRDKNGCHVWEWVCECGNTLHATTTLSYNIASCGCMFQKGNLTHGKAGSKIYQIWNWMIQRCTNPNTGTYERYGAKGITVCKKWRKFENFLKDMGEQPFPKATIDRINNNKGYSKENCRWTTPSGQARNRKTNRIIEYKGQKKTLAEWSEIYGYDQWLIAERIKRGWSLDDAFNVKPIIGRNQTWRFEQDIV